MRLKPTIIACLILLTSVGSAYGATDITGDIYGEVFRTMNMQDGGIPYGVTIDDINAGEDCDNTTQTCYVKGFSWADVIGWTVWDGIDIQNTPGMGIGNFPDEYFAKATYNGNLGGYIWGEKFGWVSLSVCDGLAQVDCNPRTYCNWTGSYCEINKASRVPDVSSQDVNDWGAYVDFCPLKTNQPACESIESDPYCNWDGVDSVCVFHSVANPNGQPLHGYAWSQYLGWIKFGIEAGDIEFTGAFTNWFPDLTPPTFEGIDEAWIPNGSPVGTIGWLEFADEKHSAIDPVNSSITVNAIDTGVGLDFEGCPSVVGGPYPNGDLVLTQGGDGAIDLSIPEIGLIGTPPYGFCKYELGGVIYNGSGFGYYFGPEGAAAAAADGVNIASPAPNVYDANAVTMYVRAGDLDLASSALVIGAGGGVGDGNDIIDLTFSPKDIGGNPIISVKSAIVPAVLPEPVQANWVRNLELLYDLTPNSEYYFDRIDVNRNIINTYPTPVKMVLSLYGFVDPMQYPLGGAASLPHIGGDYFMDTIAFAPTSSVGNVLELDSISHETIDALLPAASPKMPAIDTSALNLINSASALPANPLPRAYVFDPALEVTGGDLNAEFIVIGQPVEATYDLLNNSSDILDDYSLDHTLIFQDTGGIGEEVLEIRNINLTTLGDTTGRTDPDSGDTRYGLRRNTGTEGLNEFHSSTQNYHSPIYNFDTAADGAGIYDVDGEYYVSPEDECLTIPPCLRVDIDRTDSLSSDLAASGGIGAFTFGFTPAQYIGEAIAVQVTFGITQYLSYHAQANPYPQHALYPATPHIDAFEVKSIGLGTTGVVSGGKVFETVGGRDLETISTTSSADLRREIRRNVAVLTRTVTPCNNPAPLTSLTTTASSCVAVDDVNKTIVAVYTTDTGNPVQLGGTGNVTVPSGYTYTIILLDGTDLYIKDNLIYPPDPTTSFGMIVMQDAGGNGGNVYLDPAPTNIVGLLYDEGSLLSSPDGGTTLYYGAGGNANDLKNQLFWQGSIASRNTIGGAPNRIIPDDVDCTSWSDDAASCCEAYDLDSVRRFTTIIDSGVDFAPIGYLFSGGGSCAVGAAPNPGCALGPIPETTITLTGDSINVAASKSLDTFFIERDNRPVPPGFSSSGGLTSSQEIR